MGYRKEYLELLTTVRKVVNKEAGISVLKVYRPSFDALCELFEQGEEDHIIQAGDAILEWRETALGLIKAVLGMDGNIQSLQIVGEMHNYFPK